MGPTRDYSFNIIEKIIMYREYKNIDDVVDIALAVLAVVGSDIRLDNEIKVSYREAYNKIKTLSFDEVKEIVVALTDDEEEVYLTPQTPQENYRKGVKLYLQKDYFEAVPCFQNAAIDKHPAAMHNLAVCYYYGHGVTKDMHQAYKLWHEASEAGLEKATVALKTCFNSET